MRPCLAALAALLAGGCAARTARPVAPRCDSTPLDRGPLVVGTRAAPDLARTDVVATTNAPIGAGRNVVWSASAEFSSHPTFDTPFRPFESPRSFAGGPYRVLSFGFTQSDKAADVRRMRDQVAVHATEAEAQRDTWGYGGHSSWTGVLEFRTEASSDRVIVSTLPPAATLEATWAAAADLLGKPESTWDTVNDVAATPGSRRVPATLVLPRTHVRVGGGDRSLDVLLDGVGVRPAEPAQGSGWPRIADSIRVDGPFLLALLERKATKPRFLAWIGNDDLLEQVRYEPLDAESLRPFVGSWIRDNAASLDEVAAVAAEGKGGTPEARAKARAEWAMYYTAEYAWRLDVAPDGAATWTEDGSAWTGSVRLHDGHVVLVTETQDRRQVGEPTSPLRLDGDVLRKRGDLPTVYRRRSTP